MSPCPRPIAWSISATDAPRPATPPDPRHSALRMRARSRRLTDRSSHAGRVPAPWPEADSTMSSRGQSLSMFVVQRTFSRVRRGYDPAEVDRHLELVSQWFTSTDAGRALAEERARLHQREAEARQLLEGARLEADATLEGARLRAQADAREAERILAEAEEIRSAARLEGAAAEVVRDAEARAAAMVDAARAEADRLLADARTAAEEELTSARRAAEQLPVARRAPAAAEAAGVRG